MVVDKVDGKVILAPVDKLFFKDPQQQQLRLEGGKIDSGGFILSAG